MSTETEIPAVTPKTRVVVVGIFLTGAPIGAELDPADVESTLVFLKTGEVVKPVVKNAMPGASMSARFLPLEPGKYETRAVLRGQGGAVTHTAEHVVVETIQGQKEIKIALVRAPELVLEKAEWLEDHGKLTRNGSLTFKHKIHGTFAFSLASGDGTSLKPEFSEGAGNPWYPASYSFAATPKVKLHFKVNAPAGVKIDHVTLSSSETSALHLEANEPESLAHGASFTPVLKAKGKLPKRIAKLEAMLTLRATTSDGDPVRIASRTHQVTLYVLFGTPTGQVENHEKVGAGKLFPEGDLPQKVTPNRLDLTVKDALGATTQREAMTRLFDAVRGRDIRYYSKYHYPEIGEHDRSGFVPKAPSLHDYLWVALVKPTIGQCQDLAAAFRLYARILGISGAMEVEQIFPWPRWDADGDKRDLNDPSEPREASLTQFRPKQGKIVFVDDGRWLNAFEAVLSWDAGSGRRILYPVGEEILDDFDTSTPHHADRNASLFMERGNFKLAVMLEPEDEDAFLKADPFGVFDHDDQTLFRFEYESDSYEKGDSRQLESPARLEELVE